MSKATKTGNRKPTAAEKAAEKYRNESMAKMRADIEQREKKRKDRLRGLINACLEHFGEEEIVEAFNECIDEKYVNQMNEDEMITDLTLKGYAIFKPESIWDADRLKEFAKRNIYTAYNIQQITILF